MTVESGLVRCVSIALVVIAAAQCGGYGPAGPSSPGGGSGSPGLTVTIAAAGVSPATLTVAAGTRVTFTNNDSRAHNMSSDPHPDHGDCPEINAVGLLQPGQSRETGNLVTVRTCGYHDHDQPANDRLRGRIVVQ